MAEGGDVSGNVSKETILIETIIKAVGARAAGKTLAEWEKSQEKLQQLSTENINNYRKTFESIQKEGEEFLSITNQNTHSVLTTQKKLTKNTVAQMKYVISETGKVLDSYIDKIDKTRDHFNYGYLSIMFFGMVLQRVSQQIMKSTISVFQRIEQGGTAAGRAIVAISAEFQFLKFEVGRAIGEALLPLLPILTKMIRGMAQFIQQHPEETFYSIATVLAVGGAMSMLGQVGLFLQ
ncbi:MAG: hypothetical protein ACTSX6_14725, partial [Candidatus Heimdallarchaeaceae archaeon]